MTKIAKIYIKLNTLEHESKLLTVTWWTLSFILFHYTQPQDETGCYIELKTRFFHVTKLLLKILYEGNFRTERFSSKHPALAKIQPIIHETDGVKFYYFCTLQGKS